MAIRTQSTIDSILLKSKQNCYAREQNYGIALNTGIAQPPLLYKQLVLIWAASSDYATLQQKNVYVDFLVGDNLTTATASNLFASNLTTASL